MSNKNIFDLVLKQVIPGFATQGVADDELEDIKRDVGNQAEEPDNSCPSPSNALDPGEAPACIHGYESSHLVGQSKRVIILDKTCRYYDYNQCIEVKLLKNINVVTSCAAMKAPISKRPGRSTKDQLLDLVTKMSA